MDRLARSWGDMGLLWVMIGLLILAVGIMNLIG